MRACVRGSGEPTGRAGGGARGAAGGAAWERAPPPRARPFARAASGSAWPASRLIVLVSRRPKMAAALERPGPVTTKREPGLDGSAVAAAEAQVARPPPLSLPPAPPAVSPAPAGGPAPSPTARPAWCGGRARRHGGEAGAEAPSPVGAEPAVYPWPLPVYVSAARFSPTPSPQTLAPYPPVSLVGAHEKRSDSSAQPSLGPPIPAPPDSRRPFPSPARRVGQRGTRAGRGRKLGRGDPALPRGARAGHVGPAGLGPRSPGLDGRRAAFPYFMI